MVNAYKLFRLRKDGTLGPLFINARQRIVPGKWFKAESHPTKGFKFRPGWHATPRKYAPHLRQHGDRVWARVSLKGVKEFHKPAHQGGLWYLAKHMRVEEVLI